MVFNSVYQRNHYPACLIAVEPMACSSCRAVADAFWQNGNINELPIVADAAGLSAARTPAEILCINISAAGAALMLPNPRGAAHKCMCRKWKILTS